MATQGEKLAVLEVELRNLRDDVREVIELLGDKSKPNSVRGRLHTLEGDLAAIFMLRKASMRFVSRGWRLVLGFAALATAAAPYVLYFASR